MDSISTKILTGLAQSLTMKVLETAGLRFRKAVQGTEKQQALDRCLQASLDFAVEKALSGQQVEKSHVEELFEKFCRHDDVAREINRMLHGEPLHVETMRELFTECGYDAETLPGFDFAVFVAAFQQAFLFAAEDESELQDIVKISELKKQTGLQQDILEELRKKPEDDGSHESRYLHELVREVNVLPWAPIHDTYADPQKGEQVDLADIYIDLDTTEHERMREEAQLRRLMENIHETKRISILEAIDNHGKLLVLGDPGSGKSTFMKYLGFVLAQARLRQEETDTWLKKLTPWRHDALLPVWIELRTFAEKLAIPGLKMNALEEALYEVGYKAHEQASPGQQTVAIGKGNLCEWVKRYVADDWSKASEFVDYIRTRAGLLVPHGTESYTFPHRTIQEFLAACHLTIRDDCPQCLRDLVKADAVRWQEVFLLSAGFAARTHRLTRALETVNHLCPREVEKAKKLTADAFSHAELAARALLEIGMADVRREEVGLILLERLQHWLVAALQQDSVLEARQRAEMGQTLAHIGDPRPGVCTLPLDWVQLPGGRFTMGEGKDAREVELSPFAISRYPVTNAQFKFFIDAKGYENEKWWSEAGWRFCREQNLQQPRYWENERFNSANQPVVGVSWYEAEAFCYWLSEWRGASGEKRIVRLPSEAEWEYAAAGAARRTYPWGNGEPTPERANYDGHIDRPTAVGSYPAGATPDTGILDLAGNAWEWCADEWRKGSGSRVLRGGAWNNQPPDVACANRNNDDPSNLNDYIGFRCART